ncbi:MAG: hypothetical protein KBS54_04565 [Synergistaceae bacterium]|nr:hypothetical protein [Candidatus Equadaptatus faecalis]
MKRFTKIAVAAMAFVMIFSCVAMAAQVTYLKSPYWEPNTKKAINQMFEAYGKTSKGYNPNCKPYAVFDCDNSITVLDVEEQLAIYQLEHLRFAIKPEQMFKVLTAGIPNIDESMGEDWGNLTVRKAANDVCKAYAKLYAKGWVKADRSQEKNMAKWMATDDWKEFAAKARWMYDAICDYFDAAVGYPWITYWFAGMTPKQVQDLAAESHRFYGNKPAEFWDKITWTSPAGYPSECGPLKIKFNKGVGVTAELKELIAALDANGIDMWINSASHLDPIKAVPVVFGLKGVDGIVAMTNKIKNGKLTWEYDYDLHAQTQGLGKSLTIDKCIRPKYKGRGPIFGCMDSQGDFNFCTEYKDTKVVLIMNRGRKDDAGILSAIAVWQNKNGIDAKKAWSMGDTRYCLQGRREAGAVCMPTSYSLLLKKEDKPVLLSAKGEKWLEMLEGGMSPKDLINSETKLKGKKFYDGKPAFAGYKAR